MNASILCARRNKAPCKSGTNKECNQIIWSECNKWVESLNVEPIDCGKYSQDCATNHWRKHAGYKGKIEYCNVVVSAVQNEYISLHSPSLGASRAVRGLPRGSDKFEPKLHLLLPFPSTLPPCALLFSTVLARAFAISAPAWIPKQVVL